VFTPVDKQRLFPRSWPSLRQLNAAGKKRTNGCLDLAQGSWGLG
jgi:hypothetical protein